MPEAFTPLAYIRREMAHIPGANFIPDWKELTTQDKIDLVAWSTTEMELLGIEVKKAIGN